MKCRKCGGERTAANCKLCELFAAGPLYDGVETCRANKPQASLGAKVHPDQIPEAAEHARRNGVPTNFTPDGMPEFESRGHQKKYLDIVGMHNRDEV